MKLTIFNAKNTQNKFPESPYDDKTFIFETFDMQDIKHVYTTLVSQFCLNLPLDISKPIRCGRRLVDFKHFYPEKFDFIFLDIECNSNFNKNQVVEYFKDYKIILAESRSYDDYTCFNMKGILEIESLKLDEIKTLIAQFQDDLKDYCYINDDCIKKVFYTAPILKQKIIYENLNGVKADKIQKKLSDFITMLDRKDIKLALESSNTVDLCLEAFAKLDFKTVKINPNGSINFEKNGENYFWYRNNPYLMNHKEKHKSLSVYNIVRPLESNDLNYSNFFQDRTDVIHINEKYIEPESKEQLVEKFLFKKNGILTIKSPMGTGKSSLIKYIINESMDRDFKVLVVTNRISVAEDFRKKYNIKIYNKNDYELGDSLIVQFDSLYKYNMRNFDIVILDEFTSLLIHARSNATQNYLNLTKFISCFNKKIVLADAFLTGYEDEFVHKKENITHIVNDYRDPVNLYSISDKNDFFNICSEKIKESIKIGYTTTISCTSNKVMKALELFLIDKGYKVQMIWAETPEYTKKIIYEQLSKDRPRWDVLIYSPTITVGVNILNLVENHFHYDSSMSVDVIGSLQMIKRARKAENIYYYVAPRIQKKCLNYNTLRDIYVNNVKINSNNSYLFCVNDYGETNLSDIGTSILKIDLLLNIFKSDHKGIFEYFLKYHFEKTPIKINYEGNYEDIKKYLDLSGEITKEDINDSNIENFFDIVGFDFTINDNTEKAKLLKLLNILHEKTNLILTNEEHQIIFKKLYRCYRENRNLFTEIFFYKELLQNHNIETLKEKLSNSIINKDDNEYLFYSLLIKNNFNFDPNNTYLKDKNYKIFELAGFQLKNNKYTVKDYVKFFESYVI